MNRTLTILTIATWLAGSSVEAVSDGDAGVSEVRAGTGSRGASERLRADAGDDQIGLVGRRITLNGSRSVPRGQLLYRWIRLSGPGVSEATEEGAFYSFVPRSAGIYRFALVVASEEAISRPDEVEVIVGELPSGPEAGPAGVERAAETSALDRVAGVAGAFLDRRTVEQVAETFDSVAGRVSLYATFADLSSEMMRRFQSIIPMDVTQRRVWSQGVFAPLSRILAEEMLATGLDLRQPRGLHQPLLPMQKEQLEKSLRSYARAFREEAERP